MKTDHGSVERTVSKALLEIEAIYFSKPVFSKRGVSLPFYCDTRLILSFPRVRDVIVKILKDEIATHFPDCEMIMGVAPSGIGFAALLSKELNLPLGYVLERKKHHAFQNRVEGKFKTGCKVVLIDEMIITGRRILEDIDELKKSNLTVLGAMTVLLFDFIETKELLKTYKVNCKHLVSASFINKIALEIGKIDYQTFVKNLKKIGGDLNEISD